MANQEHLDILKQGTDVWNEWREKRPNIRPNLHGADLGEPNLFRATLRGASPFRMNLRGADLRGANLFRANLGEANLSRANLSRANLSRANLDRVDLGRANLGRVDLRRASLRVTDLREANLRGADLQGANLSRANLREANLREANLRGANLSQAALVETNLESANLTGCQVYGISAWNLKINENTKQSGLVITRNDEPTITVDDLEVAQFIYLLLNRQKLRTVIDTITSKAVLILGRFTPDRKAVLDAMADQLRSHNLLPIIFDFERATSRDFTETIKTLAGMSRFVIADITNPKSAPLELQATVPDYQIPFVPIIQEGEKPFSMFADLTKYPWVLTLLEYQSPEGLMAVFKKAIIDRAFDKYKELLKVKAQRMETISVKDFLGESS
jgi:uncharacterized protein YjbI with pentapeptide repeats